MVRTQLAAVDPVNGYTLNIHEYLKLKQGLQTLPAATGQLAE